MPNEWDKIDWVRFQLSRRILFDPVWRHRRNLRTGDIRIFEDLLGGAVEKPARLAIPDFFHTEHHLPGPDLAVLTDWYQRAGASAVKLGGVAAGFS